MQTKILPMLDINPASATLCADPITNEECEYFAKEDAGLWCVLFFSSLHTGSNNKVKRCERCLQAARNAELVQCLS